jgi:hypothetical protein
MNQQIKFNHNSDSIINALGIDEKRAHNIREYFADKAFLFMNQKIDKLSLIIEGSINDGFAKTPAELLYLGFMVGMLVSQKENKPKNKMIAQLEKIIEIMGEDSVEIVGPVMAKGPLDVPVGKKKRTVN